MSEKHRCIWTPALSQHRLPIIEPDLMDDDERVAAGILRVLIVDGDARVRRGLRALLEGEPDIVVAGEAATVEEALRCGAVLRPSVILLDLMLPTVQDGLAAVEVFTAHRRPCVAISWRDSLREAALEVGASGFVEKGASPHSVLAALRTACRKGDHQGRSQGGVLAKGKKRRRSASGSSGAECSGRGKGK